jgi:hypothetical protein
LFIDAEFRIIVSDALRPLSGIDLESFFAKLKYMADGHGIPTEG